MDPEGIHLEAPRPWRASLVQEVKTLQQSFYLLFNQSSRPSTIGSLLYHIKIRVHFNKFKFSFALLKKRQLDEFEYDLQYRRLNYLGPVVIIRANKVTNLVKLISLTRILSKVCDIYAKAKIIDSRNLQVSKQKSGILYFIFFNICGSLPPLRLDFEYFLLLINNYLCFNQVRLIKIRDNYYVTLTF